MKTILKNIYENIQGLNPSASIISSIGEFVSIQNQQVADSVRRDIMKWLPEGSLAYRIVSTADRFSDKQLWAITYELSRNQEYLNMLNQEAEELIASREIKKFHKAEKTAKKAGEKRLIEVRLEENRNLTGKVRHDRLGEGIVLSETNDTVVVNFNEHGEKTLLKKFTKLEMI